jgi:hypothetical protein
MSAFDMFFGSTKRVLMIAFAFAVLPLGCGDDEDTSAARASQRGESCHSRLDCAAGLSCLGNVCTVANFPFSPTGKECMAIECREAADCCPEPIAGCATYEALCAAGDATYCSYVQMYCVCDTSAYACEENHCVDVCDTDTDCVFGGTCVASRCVACASDDECLETQICKNQQCVEKCTEKIDCPYFHDCQAGVCVEVGCNDDRECIAATKNVLAICSTDKKCQIPCQTDAECQSGGYDFRACVNEFCVDIGCESDEECRLRMPAGQDAVCRAPAAP